MKPDLARPSCRLILFPPKSSPPGVKEWRLWEAAPRPGFVATVAVRLAAADDSADPA